MTPNEDRPGGPPVILLSDRLWRSQFHGDHGVVGKVVAVDGTAEVIIGVLPQHFSFPDLDLEPDIYAPADLDRNTTLSVNKPVVGLIFIGSTIGIGAALLLSRLLVSSLVGVTPHDVLSFSSAWVLMITVALLASSIPAAHAARTDLISVLRSE